MQTKSTILESKELTMDIAEMIKMIWEGEEMKKFFDTHENELQLSSSTIYYLENSVRFAVEDFKPNDEDILRSKIKTTGITETVFEERDIEFTLVDVGGQRAERRKWLHCFDNIDAVIYLAALDEYNMVLMEDGSTNRLEESLNLFKDVTGSQWFSEKSFVLFLNKSDLFELKIKRYPLKDFFKDAKKCDNFTSSTEFIERKYKNNYTSNSRLYIHITNALDTENCRKVFVAVRDAIIQGNLDSAGFSM